MRIYSIDFRKFIEMAEKFRSTEADRFVCYWETPQSFYLEYPVVSDKGASMGFVLRAKVDKPDILQFVADSLGGNNKFSPEEALNYFRAQYLGEYVRVIRALTPK